MGKIIIPIGTIDSFASKQEIVKLAERHSTQIIEKGYDLLRVYIELKRYLLYLGSITKTLQEKALEKAKQSGEKRFEYANAKITVQNRTKYNFESDPKWVEINQQIQILKQRKKERESQLKTISNEYMEVVDQETGEIDKLMAPIKEVMNQLMVRL